MRHVSLDFMYITIWIQVLQENEEAVNTIWIIVVQKFALFAVESFLQAAWLGIEWQETYDPVMSAKRTEVRGFLLKITARIRG